MTVSCEHSEHVIIICVQNLLINTCINLNLWILFQLYHCILSSSTNHKSHERCMYTEGIYDDDERGGGGGIVLIVWTD